MLVFRQPLSFLILTTKLHSLQLPVVRDQSPSKRNSRSFSRQSSLLSSAQRYRRSDLPRYRLPPSKRPETSWRGLLTAETLFSLAKLISFLRCFRFLLFFFFFFFWDGALKRLRWGLCYSDASLRNNRSNLAHKKLDGCWIDCAGVSPHRFARPWLVRDTFENHEFNLPLLTNTREKIFSSLLIWVYLLILRRTPVTNYYGLLHVTNKRFDTSWEK